MRTNYIHRLISRVTSSSQSNNDAFTFYGHYIDLRSGLQDYVSVTIYHTADPYSGEVADFGERYGLDVCRPTHDIAHPPAIVTDSVEAAKDTMPSRKRNDYSPIEDYHPTAQKKHDKSSWQASVSYSGGADANSSVFTERPGSAISGTEKETMEEKPHHYMPFIVSLSLQKSIGNRLGIGTGLRYTRLRTDITTVNSWNSNTRTQTVEYIGVPLNATYRLWNSGNFSLYTTAGVAADIPVSGSKTWQWSVSAGVGAQYSLTPRISVNTVFKRHASHG